MEPEKEKTRKENKETTGAIYVTPNSEGLSQEDYAKYNIQNIK